MPRGKDAREHRLEVNYVAGERRIQFLSPDLLGVDDMCASQGLMAVAMGWKDEDWPRAGWSRSCARPEHVVSIARAAAPLSRLRSDPGAEKASDRAGDVLGGGSSARARKRHESGPETGERLALARIAAWRRAQRPLERVAAVLTDWGTASEKDMTCEAEECSEVRDLRQP